MWWKIKNWLIKRLGGYTKAEYDDFSRFPVTRFEVIPERTKNIVRLQSEAWFDSFSTPPTEWTERKLIGELAMQLKPYVHWEQSEDYCRMKRAVRAVVKVVKFND